MEASLNDLIARLTAVVNDPNQRSLILHWSDVELLRAIEEELRTRAHQIEATRNAVLLAPQIAGDDKP